MMLGVVRLALSPHVGRHAEHDQQTDEERGLEALSGAGLSAGARCSAWRAAHGDRVNSR